MAAWNAPKRLDVFDKLTAAYSQPHRHYHTAAHIEDCLAQLDEARSLMDAWEEVELALWFHDAIYKPRSSKNELESARWAHSFLESVGASAERRARVSDHIMATKHDARPTIKDAMFVVDIDLSILGRAPEEYARFEGNVRKEYAWVPSFFYRRKRVAILESFLARPTIYGTEHFRARYEEQARRNVAEAIKFLRG